MNITHADQLRVINERLRQMMHTTIDAGEGSADEHDTVTELLLELHTTTFEAAIIHAIDNPRLNNRRGANTAKR